MSEPFFAVLELMGHVRIAGKVSEAEMFGAKMGRIDIPGPDDTWTTQFFSGQSVYRLTPCGEAEARAVAARAQPMPVYAWEMPRGLPQSGHQEYVDPDHAPEREDQEDEYEEEPPC